MAKRQFVGDKHFRGYGIELCPLGPRDLPSLRRWRNDPQIGKQMTDSFYITPNQQRCWYENITDRVDQAHWVVWCKGVRTGYVNIKGEGPLELQNQLAGGFYSGKSSVKHGLLGYAIVMMQLDIAFQHLSATIFRGPVLKSNVSARRLNKQLGYREEWENDTLVGVVLTSDAYEIAKKSLTKYFDESICLLVG